ncbi:unnamed protein product [Eruca vesicaria subsp. sativa]|uniref:F-box domain-containing protein n=1 Tax=Eruca vesicaria subsp. sativa TaxID=29727 RepID=A0ABC8KKZ6_ERUVS|nr:unnamed protein product [Eruca vesicaria subsp. sativa]
MSGVGYDWSKLCSDLLRSILESLSTYDFHRARSVCSSWYSVSTTCMRPLYPWRILLRNSSTLIFDPEQDKTLEAEHPGTDFSESCVIASCSNWLLIIDSRDYVVALSYMQHDLFLYKKGDDTWRKHEGTRCRSMVYKKNKLYVLTCDDYVKILDLSGELVNEIVEGNPYHNHRFQFVTQLGEHVWTKKIAITNPGEILIVVSLKGLQKKRMLYMFKMNVENGNWERVDSLGGDMLVFGHGVTIKSDYIYFSGHDLWPGGPDYLCTYRKINWGIFDLGTSTITWPTKTTDASALKSFWFVPGYA